MIKNDLFFILRQHYQQHYRNHFENFNHPITYLLQSSISAYKNESAVPVY